MAGAPRPLIAGNWKMNGLAKPAVKEFKALARRLAGLDRRLSCDLLVCPPATLIAPLRQTLKGLGLQRRMALGGQDCHVAQAGAHTGDIGAAMLADAGCRYVIVGHSERRGGHGETDTLVRAKARSAIGAGLVPIVCVGESESERGAGQAPAVISRQLAGSLPMGDPAGDPEEDGEFVVAYEPVWAIGTGRSATPQDVAEVHAQIRALLRESRGAEVGSEIRILYGGSVKAVNAAALLGLENVDGALVGGASLDAKEFWSIGAACP